MSTEGLAQSSDSSPTRPSLRGALIFATAFLTCLGLLAIYASSSIPAAQKFGDPFIFVKKQAIIAAFGFGLIAASQRIPFVWIECLTLPAVFGALGLLGLTFVPGLSSRAYGAARWLSIGGMQFQPAEVAKVALVMFLAKNLSRPKCNVEKLGSGILPNALAFASFAVPLMLQPDFGSTFLLFSLTFLMLFVAGVPRKFIAITSGLGLVGVVAAIAAAPYRLKRLTGFLDPWAQIKTGGFQIIQSYLAFQNGGLLGVGLGESRQKLFFLPEAHTDFILSVIGEEMGLLGVLLVCSLFLYITYTGYRITAQQLVPYRKFLAFGLTVLIAAQACINMGVTMGLLPTKGMTLPFISSGASSLLVFLFAVAILSRLASEETHHGRKDS